MGRTAAVGVSHALPVVGSRCRRDAAAQQRSTATRSGGSIDVQTGVGNFLNGAIPNQDMVAVSSGG